MRATSPEVVNSSAKEIISPFERLLANLNVAEIDYAVVGGVAVIANGYLRLTDDLDIIVNDRPENIRKLLECLRQWGEGWARELKPEDFVPQEGCLRVMEEFDLDIFTHMRGKSLEDFRPRLRCLETSSTRIPHLSPEDLIFLKQGSWREKDQLDLLAMKEILAREQRAR